MSYIDGFAAAVRAEKREAYIAYAETMNPIFVKHGAERVVECWGDDVLEGEITSFSMAVQRGADEVVAFSWIWWPNKAARDAGWKAFMEDPIHQTIGREDMPFDGARMIFGGFEVISVIGG